MSESSTALREPPRRREEVMHRLQCNVGETDRMHYHWHPPCSSSKSVTRRLYYIPYQIAMFDIVGNDSASTLTN
jgi:hypothetical protein